jgi:hypothetical protein
MINRKTAYLEGMEDISLEKKIEKVQDIPFVAHAEVREGVLEVTLDLYKMKDVETYSMQISNLGKCLDEIPVPKYIDLGLVNSGHRNDEIGLLLYFLKGYDFWYSAKDRKAWKSVIVQFTSHIDGTQDRFRLKE